MNQYITATTTEIDVENTGKYQEDTGVVNSKWK